MQRNGRGRIISVAGEQEAIEGFSKVPLRRMDKG
jgi:hypothetical protein